MAYDVQKTDDEWREQLSREEYAVLRKAGTERPFTGEYTDTKTVGVYRCRACDAELFKSETKFDSHCGWPSFYAPLAEDRVEYIEDRSMGMKRVEVRMSPRLDWCEPSVLEKATAQPGSSPSATPSRR